MQIKRSIASPRRKLAIPGMTCQQFAKKQLCIDSRKDHAKTTKLSRIGENLVKTYKNFSEHNAKKFV